MEDAAASLERFSITINNINMNDPLSCSNNEQDYVMESAIVDAPSSNTTTPLSILERTIFHMEHSQICLHPKHYHSFQTVHFLLFSLQKCIVCNVRLHSVFGSSGSESSNGGSSSQVVKCLACGALAHRSCALSTTNHNVTTWSMTPCPVNAAKVTMHMTKSTINGTDSSRQIITQDDDEEEDGECVELPSDDAIMDESMLFVDPVETTSSFDASTDPTACDDLPQALQIPSMSLAKSDSSSSSSMPDDAVNDDNSNDNQPAPENTSIPLHYANHPFASVSKALQENITAFFAQSATAAVAADADGEASAAATNTSTSTTVTTNNINTTTAPQTRQRSGYFGHQIIAAQLQETVDADGRGSSPDATQSDQRQIEHEAQNHLVSLDATFDNRNLFDKVKTSVLTPQVVGAAFAGGVAGFVLAGPVGAFAGWRLGGGTALGVILEGSVGMGVVVASVAGAGFTAQQIQDSIQESADRRVLTMGETGTSRKVLLVRPNVQMDPVWNQIYADIRKNAPNQLSQMSIPFLVDATTHDRYRRDADIIKTDEGEIPTNDKVLLLVGRALSDKTSLPGYVYRELIAVFTKRCVDRNHYLETNPSILATSPRARRDDAHALIKYVTATLLEVRPNFGATAGVTELTASAVESLIFGNIYDMVMDEIKGETAEMDRALSQKFAVFTADNDKMSAKMASSITIDALNALRLLPEAHSPVDKLRYCVAFLERLSEHFLSSNSRGCSVGADSLLKMVCQHVIVARVVNLNAEVVFLEEFARDEQLLRGREGYSLVTLQAALHFLNMSHDLEADIVDQDDDEENIPI